MTDRDETPDGASSTTTLPRPAPDDRMPGDRKHFVKSQPNHRSTKHVLEATTDLADEIAEGYGVDTPGVEHARAEIARLRG
jgi:hypothetical protein